jgi:uncharacterized protein
MPRTQIGLIADTHGLLRPEAVAALRGCKSYHPRRRHRLAQRRVAGRARSALARIAPLTVVRGNNDRADWATPIPWTADVEFDGVRIHVLHILGELAIDLAAAGVKVVVSGHSHRPHVETRCGVLFVNPGSAGPRRFKLPVSVARLWLEDGRAEAELVTLLY